MPEPPKRESTTRQELRSIDSHGAEVQKDP
jgi:hypothetical protein